MVSGLMAAPQTPVQLLEEIAHLMQLAGENPFKTRAFEKAAGLLAEVSESDLKVRARAGTLTELEGIGKGISEVLTEFLLHGTSKAREELVASLPRGLLELTQIPGLGPKKATQLIEELGIESIRELEYACKENRLLKIKGFGEKLQHKILESIAFLHSSEGQARLDEILPAAQKLITELREALGVRVEESGALRRRCEVLSEVELLIEAGASVNEAGASVKKIEAILAKNPLKIEVKPSFADPKQWGYEWAKSTASEEHWKGLKSPACPRGALASTEEAFYQEHGLPWIEPVMRETGSELLRAKQKGEKGLGGVIQSIDLKGLFHCHTTRSDGAATLEEMVEAARTRGYHYLGISDHSQSAFYAQGLKSDTLQEQEREIRKLQEKIDQKHGGFKIFWGIESDILKDGSLDYSDSVLKRFDFVIASIHQRFQADRETMTERIVQAIRNPYTRFIGHLTGRLLLGRKAYDIDIERIIREAHEHDVAIELNAHPQRLDIDWRWGPELQKQGTLISINPDAHEISGLDDTQYGVWMAQKALMPKHQVINTRSSDEVARWLARK